MVPGATSIPCSISSTISSTTVAAVATSPGSPSSVRTLPRRWSSASSRPRKALRTPSSEPASSAATLLSRVSCLRAKSSPTPSTQLLPHRGANPLAVRPAADLRHQRRHHLAHLALLGSAGLLDRALNQLRQLLVGELLRQVALDQLCLEALGSRLLSPAGALVSLRRLDPFLALALQYRDLVALAHLRVLLQHVDDHPQRPCALAIPGFHRRPHVVLHLIKDRHRLKGNRRRPG